MAVYTFLGAFNQNYYRPALMLLVIAIRCARGHFSPRNHFGFEAVAWYWHFVDVVWLGLFIFVYVF